MNRAHRILAATMLVLALMFAASTSRAQNGSFDTVTTASGLRYVITHHGNGPSPSVGSYPIVHYTGTLTDGTVFDDSRKRSEPFAFKLGVGQVIKGWDEGIALMHVGDRATLMTPPAIGYGEKGAGKVIPPNATLVFDVDLLDVKTQTLGGMLSEVIDSKGIGAAQRAFAQWKKGPRDAYYVSEADLNAIGYRYLKMEKKNEAI